MVRIAQRQASQLNMLNFSCLELDGEDLSSLEDDRFDAVTCLFGMQQMPDYKVAAQEFYRVLNKEHNGIAVAMIFGEQESQKEFLSVVEASVNGIQEKLPQKVRDERMLLHVFR